ncbi:MAG: 7-carboxy-7-deazaguanine synthase QueE [Candidatus Margulisbacteria bacterium]|nr:7-carboxy-7-deazaguanine synthase QueE [Candidatus Margulisiibacteriota bacterium]
MNPKTAQLAEVFSSIQGEGIYVGERQFFVRFAGCNLSCQYCDSPQALEIKPNYRFEAVPGAHKWESRGNPVTTPQLVELLTSLDKPGLDHSLSLTGGEPLLQVEFLKEFLPTVKAALKLPIYLETNGTLPEHLNEVIDLVDIIAMDIKLPSLAYRQAGATGLSPYWKEHKKFLEIAYLKEVFVKIVVAKETKIMEIDEAAKLIAAVDEKIPLVLQPVTPHGQIKHRPGAEEILAFQATAKRKLKTVRVIPQIHKLLGLS